MILATVALFLVLLLFFVALFVIVATLLKIALRPLPRSVAEHRGPGPRRQIPLGVATGGSPSQPRRSPGPADLRQK